MRDGNAVTSPQTLEIPPLHTTLETLANPRRSLVGIVQVTTRPRLRFSNNIHMLARNKVNSRECGSCIVGEASQGLVSHEHACPHRLERERLE